MSRAEHSESDTELAFAKAMRRLHAKAQPATPRPTPPEVLQAITTIANYCKRGGWKECVIWDNGGTAFHLDHMVERQAEGRAAW